MSTLIVHELGQSADDPVQEITIKDTNVNLTNVRLDLYRHNSPAGSLVVRVKDQNDRQIAESNSVTITSIGSDSYFHGWVTFNVTAALRKEQSYRFTLDSSGYSFSEAAYVGWNKQWDRPVSDISYSAPNADYSSALGLQLWEQNDFRRGNQ